MACSQPSRTMPVCWPLMDDESAAHLIEQSKSADAMAVPQASLYDTACFLQSHLAADNKSNACVILKA